MHQKVSPHEKKKVQFDSARVSFQVEYDVPDDRSLRAKIPIWREHWKKSKTSLALQLLRALNTRQWLKVLFALFSLSALSSQLFHQLEHFLRRETLITADFRPSLSWPAVSLCAPFLVPFCNNTCSLAPLFNQSIALFHRCKHVTVEERTRLCPPPIVWIQNSRKCFTYWSEEEIRRLELLVQSETQIQLFVHSKDTLPLQHFQPIDKDKDTLLLFSKTIVDSREDPKTNCQSRESQSDCLSRCLLNACDNHCVAKSAPIRLDLLEREHRFCRETNTCEREDQCHAECLPNCLVTAFHLSLREELSRDQTETNVSLVRQETPDLLLRHVRRVTCVDLISRFGGLLAFWSLLFLFFSKTLDFFALIREIIEIYFS